MKSVALGIGSLRTILSLSGHWPAYLPTLLVAPCVSFDLKSTSKSISISMNHPSMFILRPQSLRLYSRAHSERAWMKRPVSHCVYYFSVLFAKRWTLSSFFCDFSPFTLCPDAARLECTFLASRLSSFISHCSTSTRNSSISRPQGNKNFFSLQDACAPSFNTSN